MTRPDPQYVVLAFYPSPARTNQFFKYYYKQAWTTDSNGAAEETCSDVFNSVKAVELWRFDLKDKNGFSDALKEAGLSPDWVSCGDREDWPECFDPDGNCLFNFSRWFHDFPVKADDYEVADVKEVLEKAFGGDNPVLLGQLTAAYFDGGLIQVNDEDKPVDWEEVLSVPTFMATHMLESMKKVKEIAKQVDVENKKQLILLIVESVLFAIPFIGSAAGSLGRTGTLIARMIYLLDTVGNADLRVYTTI
ncbi:hypothetical protein ACHAPJ_010614 [Fusarium lateritium]